MRQARVTPATSSCRCGCKPRVFHPRRDRCRRAAVHAHGARSTAHAVSASSLLTWFHVEPGPCVQGARVGPWGLYTATPAASACLRLLSAFTPSRRRSGAYHQRLGSSTSAIAGNSSPKLRRPEIAAAAASSGKSQRPVLELKVSAAPQSGGRRLVRTGLVACVAMDPQPSLVWDLIAVGLPSTGVAARRAEHSFHVEHRHLASRRRRCAAGRLRDRLRVGDASKPRDESPEDVPRGTIGPRFARGPIEQPIAQNWTNGSGSRRARDNGHWVASHRAQTSPPGRFHVEPYACAAQGRIEDNLRHAGASRRGSHGPGVDT
jgi:hypothetical protein